MCHDFLNWTLPSSGRENGYEYRRTSTFSLPFDAATMDFNAMGAAVRGTFEVSSTAPSDSTAAIVDVDVYYSNPQSFRDATTCRTRLSDQWGFRIFVSPFI